LLKLKKVELQGFKSFCDKTELRFQGDGIAAIVGPNGCGKSNLSDAISWVLGEQSARSLRGAKMEDVIFAGTKARKPVGMASVTMVLVDPQAREIPAQPPLETLEGEAPAADPQIADNVHEIHSASGHAIIHHPGNKAGEISITRRLFRSGESEYLIDGRTARLRDIQDIFMGSGLGPESYAIIEQGRIGQILSSKPQDRRAVLEEAAGITKYKARRRLAEARLESARQNLSRVFDILEEVTRQVNSLKRQAAKARRYNELREELTAQLRAVLAGRFLVLNSEASRVSALLDEATAELREATESAAIRDAERTTAQEAFYALEKELTAARARLAELNVEIARTRGRLESQVREATGIEQRMGRAEQESAQLELSVAAAGSEQAAIAQSVAALDMEMQVARSGLMEMNRRRDDVQIRLRESSQAIDALRNAVLRLLGEASGIRNQIAQADTYLASIERERARSTREEEVANAEIERLAKVKRDLSDNMAQRQMELETVTQGRLRTEQELTSRRAEINGLRQEIDRLRGACSTLKARRDSIENVLSHHTYTTESTRRLLTELESGRAGDFRPEGVLADFIDVDGQWERAAEEFLHDELEFVVVRNWDEAEKSMTLLRGELEGRASFLIENSMIENAGADGSRATAVAQPSLEQPSLELPRLTDFVRFTNGLTGQANALLPRLSRCYLAGDREQARALADANPETWFLLPSGESYHGRVLTGGRKTASGPLALKREMREFSDELQVHEQSLAGKVAALEALEKDAVRLAAELENLRQLQQSREKDAVSLDHDLRRAGEEMHRANSRISVARLELDRLTREEERAREKLTENQQLVAEKDAARAAKEQELESLREKLEAAQAEARGIDEQHSVLRARLAGLEERARAERAALSRLENQQRVMTARRQEITAETARWGETRARILADNIDLDTRLTTLAADIETAERQVLELTEQEARQRAGLAQADEILRELRTRIEAGHTRRSELEIELTRRQSELQFLDETSRKELGTPVAELPEPLFEAVPEGSGADPLRLAEAACEETRRKIENLGAVNSQAFEEFQEASQRQEFLTVQRQDLLESIGDTEKAIHEIDEVSKTRFTEAFRAINENFGQCFQTLFGGGTGEMRLTDESNAIESGIDIIASPPGKKLQNVLLLSGGEKALTALSLLMAIFKYQPSPFCVLDEVDAPLDEANIGRLTRLLAEMATDTQFVVITHSKRTMEAAQAMYGVTMQEAGVSRLVSVKFQQSNRATAA
jgi:chromosome segregation protein